MVANPHFSIYIEICESANKIEQHKMKYKGKPYIHFKYPIFKYWKEGTRRDIERHEKRKNEH